MALHHRQLLWDGVVGGSPITPAAQCRLTWSDPWPARALQPVHQLSGGERLKLDLLMVLALQPELLLDEPDNHLDHASRQLLIQVLADYPGTLLLISHDPEFVEGVGISRCL